MRKLIFSTFFSLVFLFLLPASVHAATLYWVGADGANASVASNWKTTNPTTCGSGDSGAAPASGDTINFDADCDNGASWDASATSAVTTLTLNSGYAGTVTLARSLTVSGTTTITGGTFDSSTQALSFAALTVSGGIATLGSSSSLSASGTVTLSSGSLTLPSGADLNGALTISAGTFNAPSGIMTLAAGLTISGSPVFNANGGTITFDGSNATLSCNNVTFNLVNLTGSNKTINSNCNLPLGNNPSTTGNITSLLGTLSGTGTLTISGSLNTIGSTGAFSGFTGFAIGSVSFTVSGATLDFSGYSTFTQAGNTINVSSGSLTLPSGVVLNGNLNVNGGTVTLPSGADLNGALTISSGTFNAPSGTMTLAGALTISGSPVFNTNGGTITFDGGSVSLNCNNVTFNFVTFNNTGQKTVGSNCSMPIGNSPTLGTGNIVLNGTLSGSGTITQISGTPTLILNSGAMLSGFSGLNITSIIISGATVDLSSYSQADISITFSFSSGILTAPSGIMRVGGAFLHAGGTFNANSGTVILTGNQPVNGGHQSFTGTTTFYNLTKTISSATTLTFPASTTTTVAGTLTLQGSSGNNLSLRSSTSGTQWSIDPQGARVISNVDVKDSNNINATVIPAGVGGVDSGNNIGWSFSTSPITFNLDSPGDQDYINNDRPTFKWKAATDNAGSSISGYDLNIDNGSSGSWSITNIPSSGTTDYVTSKYVVHYDNFADSDTTNNYISVSTKSSSDWSSDSNSGQNDGKLKEGRRSWTITAHDSAGNSQSAGRTLFVDLTNPSLTNLKLSSTSISGRLTDPLSANDGNTSSQNEDGPKIASGPRLVEIKIVKKGDFVVNIDKLYWTCDDTQVTDNTKQKCDKHHDFYFTPTPKLTAGTYQVTLTGKDHAGNSSTLSTFSLSVGGGGSQSTVLDPVSSQDEPLPATPAENTPATEPALPVQAPIHKSLPSFMLDIFKAIKTFILNLISWIVKLFTA